MTCVFTNEKDARIVVQKQTDPDGAAQTFSFSASYDADGFSLSDGQSDDSGDLDPGTYSVSETVPANWVLTSAVCSDQSPASAIELSAGEVVTCVFTNTLDRGRIIVEKQTLPNGDPQVFHLRRELRRRRLLSVGRAVEQLGPAPARHLLGLRGRARGLGAGVCSVLGRVARRRDLASVR